MYTETVDYLIADRFADKRDASTPAGGWTFKTASEFVFLETLGLDASIGDHVLMGCDYRELASIWNDG